MFSICGVRFRAAIEAQSRGNHRNAVRVQTKEGDILGAGLGCERLKAGRLIANDAMRLILAQAIDDKRTRAPCEGGFDLVWRIAQAGHSDRLRDASLLQ